MILTHARCMTKTSISIFFLHHVELYGNNPEILFPPASSFQHATLGIFAGPRQHYQWFLQFSGHFIYEKKVTLWYLRICFQILYSLVETKTAISYPIQSILISIYRWPSLRNQRWALTLQCYFPFPSLFPLLSSTFFLSEAIWSPSSSTVSGIQGEAWGGK